MMDKNIESWKHPVVMAHVKTCTPPQHPPPRDGPESAPSRINTSPQTPNQVRQQSHEDSSGLMGSGGRGRDAEEARAAQLRSDEQLIGRILSAE